MGWTTQDPILALAALLDGLETASLCFQGILDGLQEMYCLDRTSLCKAISGRQRGLISSLVPSSRLTW